MSIDAATLKIVNVVQARLNSGPHTRRVRVLADEVSRQNIDGVEVWYIPVSIHRNPEILGDLYNDLAAIEDSLHSEQQSVLLAPRIVPFEKWENLAG